MWSVASAEESSSTTFARMEPRYVRDGSDFDGANHRIDRLGRPLPLPGRSPAATAVRSDATASGGGYEKQCDWQNAMAACRGGGTW
jgi:hypothetical protein